MLFHWDSKKEDDQLKYSQLTEWNQPLNENDCYFCKTDVRGYNSKNKDTLKYAQVRSVKKAVERGQKEDVDEYLNVLETLSIESESEDYNDEQKKTKNDNYNNESNSVEDFSELEDGEDESDEFLPSKGNTLTVKKFTQAELYDLVRDIGYLKMEQSI